MADYQPAHEPDHFMKHNPYRVPVTPLAEQGIVPRPNYWGIRIWNLILLVFAIATAAVMIAIATSDHTRSAAHPIYSRLFTVLFASAISCAAYGSGYVAAVRQTRPALIWSAASNSIMALALTGTMVFIGARVSEQDELLTFLLVADLVGLVWLLPCIRNGFIAWKHLRR